MSNLYKLPVFVDGMKTSKGEQAVRCVVEAPMGSPTKFKYDPETKTFVLGRPLLKGLTYPYDWGFIPSTLADDGDPLDVMILHDTPSFTGLVIPAQLIGVLEVEQHEGRHTVRNDRLFAVPVKSHREDELNHVDDLCKRLRKELEKFFVATAALDDKELSFLGWKGPKEAHAVLDEAMKGWAKKNS
ncbi:MAG TPA: inorganic diphosphatase [Casimicrobiaceae bacterium]|nr:inorganic diphosphatase [Casimicrobiaceae bacterium]